ncbi:hypothetical protein PsYK624_071000 [Phanerochaete sordida]|uniref:Tail specific protease domain-containing protein n=1 Tax=Phanerochaete sordida TaxID=48140 RepID=A0A9P3G9T7_9APHY|nr:hypothetical protein PsYK624_071000 [Phanerochaete sordida]
MRMRAEPSWPWHMRQALPECLMDEENMPGIKDVLQASLLLQKSFGVLESGAADPCATIAGQKWVSPAQVRACFTSFKVDPELKANIVDVVNKTLAFHTSVNYELLAPPPFSADVHENLLADLARISQQQYPSDFDLHIDMSRTLKRLNDGHCVYINDCFDSLFLTFLPTPLVLLTNPDKSQSVHIAPEAFTVASAEFADELSVWQDALPGQLRGQLASLSGAKVLAINGQDPFVAVDANALIAGSFQPLGTRQNGFFASYQRVDTGWNYVMGQFAQMSLPLADSATLTVVRVNHTLPETFTLPFRSRIGTTAVPWTNSTTFRQNNCVAVAGTNGENINDPSNPLRRRAAAVRPVDKFRQSPVVPSAQHARNVMLDTTPLQDIVLPPGLTPAGNVPGSAGVTEFFLLDDGKTGVLALGSFEDTGSFDSFETTLLTGLVNLKNAGATQLIVDVSNNGGGFICIAHWLHRIIVGPKSTSVPQAGLNTTARAGPLAQQIVKQILTNPAIDPNVNLLYNPRNWFFPQNNTEFPATFDWLDPAVHKVINGRQDMFSLELSDGCQPFDMEPPAEALFPGAKTVVVSNGRCASSCALFSITMAKEEGAKTVVLGGKNDVEQRYTGTVGGQSTDFSEIDTNVKTALLKNNSLAPPDFKTNSVQGITWRLGFGIQDPTQPEEWQDHPADVNLPLTADIVNNPLAIWKKVVETVF